jgi:hypothetical protein
MSDIPSGPQRDFLGRAIDPLGRESDAPRWGGGPGAGSARPVHTEVEVYPLAQPNEALERLRAASIQGAAVLVVD